jgi:hypothetical protein
MGSIPVIPKAQNVPLLLCREQFNKASLPVEKFGFEPRTLGY